VFSSPSEGRGHRFKSCRVRQSFQRLRKFFELAKEHELDYSNIAYKAGVSSETIYRWQKSNVPNLVTFSACLEAMGYELTIKNR